MQPGDMRLLVLSLLALGAHAHSIAYRANLLGYTPARGEFPVESGLAQGYVRYLDSTGAERLVAYNYPEPLYGIRRLSYGNEDIVNPLLRSSLFSTSALASSSNQEQTALFRAWCEQRYNALRAELERLRAEGKKPSANMLAQFEPLEQIVKTAAYESVPGLSPEVQRARDAHLRIWNEARLQVLRAEEQHLRLAQTQPQYVNEAITQFKQNPIPQLKPQGPVVEVKTAPLAYAALNQQPSIGEGPQPVQETPEVLRAREEHLKKFNAVLQQQPTTVNAELPILKAVPGIQQPQQIIPATQTIPLFTPSLKTTQLGAGYNFEGPQSPQPVEETPEVKRAREEHLKQYNEAIQRQPLISETQPQPQQPIAVLPLAVKSTYNLPGAAITIQDTPEVLRAREEHLRILNQAKLRAEDKLADIDDLIIYEQRERDAERQREIEQLRELEQQAELERKREAERLKEETRLLEAERITLKQQEQQSRESERIEEEQRLKADKELKKYSNVETGIYETQKPAEVSGSSFKLIAPANTVAQPQQQQQLQQNGFFLRIQSQQPAVASTPSAGAYVIGDPNANPFLLRYTQQLAELKPVALPLTGGAIIAQAQPLPLPLPQQLKSVASEGGNLSQLDKATREHFRAHEIALEQLRLANTKNPWNPDCN